MLNWDEAESMGSLEDVLCRTFTADVEQFGQVKSVDLKEDGGNIMVT